jgi:UDP-N-acetyl-D-glucosamine dehydrogenase
MELLTSKGAEISYSDPHVPIFPKLREHYFDLSSIDLTEESISGFDCVLIATNHKAFDYDLIRKHARLIVDSRGIYREKNIKIIKA